MKTYNIVSSFAVQATGICAVLSALVMFPASAEEEQRFLKNADLSGGGWSNAANWHNGVPEPTDWVVLGMSNQRTIVINDADAALVSSLSLVETTNANTTVIFDVSTNTVCGCAFRGVGKFVKRGKGDLELTSEDSVGDSIAVVKWGNLTPVYQAKGGMVVEEGALVLAQGKANDFPYLWVSPMVVSNGAQLVIHDYRETQLLQLMGDGVVTNRGATTRVVKLGNSRNAMHSTYGVPNTAFRFGGAFLGTNITLEVHGRFDLTGASSTVSKTVVIERDKDTMDYGVVGIGKLGKLSDGCSSIGGPTVTKWNGFAFSNNGGFVYLGDEDDVTDRVISFGIQTYNNGYAPFTMHGGHRGGLTLAGGVERASFGSEYLAGTVILDGSNSVPCVMSGPFKTRLEKDGVGYDAAVVKRGSGVWRLNKNNSTTFRGLLDVQEGTLQFDTLANSGTLCALGYADNLTENRYGPWNASKTCDYAIRLGTTNNAAPAVLEFVGSASGAATNRFVKMFGDGHVRASGSSGVAISLSGISAASDGAAVKTLTLDGANTAANEVREVSDGEGRIKVVKDGAGTWRLDGNQTFTGGISVSNGMLTVVSGRIYTYFRVGFLDGYGNPNGGYVRELALYDANGKRVNLGLEFDLPEGASWADYWTPPSNSAQYLAPGKMTFDNLPGVGYNYYLYNDFSRTYGPLAYLTDGTTKMAQFSRSFTASNKLYVSMHLTNTTEVAYVDFAQDNSNYNSAGTQTPSALKLEGSVDGVNWKTLVATNGLPLKTGGWYFSASAKTVGGYPGDRELGEGEGLAFTSPAREETGSSVLANLGPVSVARGATLNTEGMASPVITSLVIDGVNGAGTIEGFTFGANVSVDITGLPPNGGARTLDAAFSSCAGFAEANWTFTVDGSPSESYKFRFSGDTLRISKAGTRIILF